MPNTREKMIELIDQKQVYGIDKEQPRKHDILLMDNDELADHLIAHGVTVQDVPDNNVGKWISVKDERKPKDRRNYFIAYVFSDSDMHFFGEAKYHAYEGNGIVDRPHFSNEGVDGMRVTHWMEIPKLPQPPKGEQQCE